MEEDRAQSDLGVAADIEEAHAPPPAQRQPKKRFVGRRTAAADAAKKDGAGSTAGANGAVEGKI